MTATSGLSDPSTALVIAYWDGRRIPPDEQMAAARSKLADRAAKCGQPA